MLKALLWKEWREQRQIAYTGLAVTLLVPALVISIGIFANERTDFLELSDMIPFLMATLVWPLFAALVGATTNAEEMRTEVAAFLFSRPISRTQVWAVKLTTGAIALAFIVSVSYFLAQLIDLWLGGPGFRFPFSSDPLALRALGDAGVRAAAVGMVLVSFAGSVLLSTLLQRPAAAALGGVGLGLLVATAAAYAQSFFGPSRLGNEEFVLALAVIASVGLLCVSAYAFRAGDLQQRGRRRVLVLVAGSLLVLLGPGSFAAAAYATRIDADVETLSFVAAIPGTDTMVVRTSRSSFSGTRYYLASAGGYLRRLTGRLATRGQLSPDGEWLLYESRLGSWNMQSRCSLRAARIDGGEDRMILDPNTPGGCSQSASFSPDGTRFLLYDSYYRDDLQSSLYRVRFYDFESGAETSRFEFGRSEDTRARMWTVGGWLDEDSVLLFGRRGVATLDAASGELTFVYEPDRELTSIRTIAHQGRRVIFRESYAISADQYLSGAPIAESASKVLDLDSGRLAGFPRLCPGAWSSSGRLSMDGTELFYTCRGYSAIGQLRVFDMESGTHRTLAEFDGQVTSFSRSRISDRLVVDIRTPLDYLESLSSRYYDYQRSTFVVSPDGEKHELDVTRSRWIYRGSVTGERLWDRQRPRWYIDDWSGDGRLVVFGADGPTGLAHGYLDPDTPGPEITIVAGGER